MRWDRPRGAGSYSLLLGLFADVTKHLRVLSAAGVARSRRSGRERIWEIESRRLTEVRQYLGEISAQWDEALTRLQRMVEKGS